MAELRRVDLDEGFFEGAVSFERGDGWLRPWRLPFDQFPLFPPNDTVTAAASRTSGVRVRVRTDSPRVGLAFRPVGKVDNACLDLTIDGELAGSVHVGPEDKQVVFEDLGSEQKTVELWLSQACQIEPRGLLFEDGAAVDVPPDDRPKWIAYGSSITNCLAAHSPARTWPATVARANGLNLTSLGFGGNCHMEPMVARTIRDLDADFISLKLGINVYGACSLSPRTFRAAAIGVVKTIRDRHTDIPIALVSAIAAPERETVKNNVGLSLCDMRRELKDAAGRLIQCGDPNLHYFDGLELLGLDVAEQYLTDGVHPNGDGYEYLGRNFSRVVLGQITL